MSAPSTGHPLGDFFIYVAGVLVALGTIQRYIWPGLKAAGSGIKGAWRLYRGTQQFIHDWTGGGQQKSIPDRLDAIEGEVRKTNGGSTLRDLAIAAATAASRVEATVDRLEGYASANRDGIARLDRRLTDVDEKVEHQGERITEHRRRNEETIDRLESYLGDEREQLVIRSQALEASVHELLNIEGGVRRAARDNT